MMNGKVLISQSMVKDLVKYRKDKLCGLIFNNKWILNQFGKGTKANDLGHYFEYLCTGALGKGETEPPQPQRTKKGEVTSEFKLAQKQAVYFKELISKYGITNIKAGVKELADEKWIGTLDIKARWDSLFKHGALKDFYIEPDELNPNNEVIIDLKFTGLLEDKWNEFGWHLDYLPSKESPMFQAKHYKFLFWKKYGFNPPFFFFVFDQKEVGKCKIIYVDINEAELMQHEVFLKKAEAYLNSQLEIGFKPKPTYEQCVSCDYRKWCNFKDEVPPIVTVKPE